MSKVLEGMNIIAQYEPDAELCAEHDEVWFGSDNSFENIPEELIEKLESLGWHQYQEGWHHFV